MATKKPPPRSEASHKLADAVRDFVVDTTAEGFGETSAKVERKLSETERKLSDKLARQQEKISQKAARHLDQIDRLASQLETLDIWTRVEPAGRRPRFSRDQIAAAAIRIADAEGKDALSMRRLAAELDAGTMTLYHYVRTKDELLALVMDAVMAEVVIPPGDPMPASWREAMTLIANRSRAVLQRHPWTLDITDDPAIGPNSVRHFDQTLQAVSSLDIDLAAKLDLVSTVDEFVFGYCLNQRNNVESDTGFDRDMIDYVSGLIDTGDYPALTALADGIGLDPAWDQIEAHLRDQTRFARNLDRLLDGFEAGLGRGSGGARES